MHIAMTTTGHINNYHNGRDFCHVRYLTENLIVGTRTHIGIMQADKVTVEFIYGHWRAPLFRGGADLLLGDLDPLDYQYCGFKPLSDLEPDLSIEVAYLFDGGKWQYAETNGPWRKLTRKAVNRAYKAEIAFYKERMQLWKDCAEWYHTLRDEFLTFKSQELSPLTEFPDLPLFD